MKKNRPGSAGNHARRDWELWLAIAALVVLAPAALVLGLSVATASAAAGPTAKAAYAGTPDAPGCNDRRSLYAPAVNAESAPFQLSILRNLASVGCNNMWLQLGDLVDSVGLPDGQGQWPTLSLNGQTATMSGNLSLLYARVGACSTAVASTTCTNGTLARTLRELLEAAGAWRTATSDYTPRTQLWLSDRIDTKTQTVIDRLDAVNTKLTTLHTDLRDVVTAVGAAPGGGGGGLSTADQQLLDADFGALHSDFWFLMGTAAAALTCAGLWKVVRP